MYWGAFERERQHLEGLIYAHLSFSRALGNMSVASLQTTELQQGYFLGDFPSLRQAYLETN